ncbi:hypothetical protein OEZ86_002770 [Tetradesmus obliquus]|nr:hypothetical protein OEZ86_002770 [Tetradesmus obliquus]
MAIMASRAQVGVQLCFMFLCTLSLSVSAGFTKWSSYAPAPVGRPCPAAAREGRAPNGMWGCDGEAWVPAGPLSDWSFAGFGAGMQSIPSYPAKLDVKANYGAKGDGNTDDTRAIQAALAATKQSGGVLYFPPGTYKLSAQLTLDSNQVLRGAGRDRTKLFFTKSMVDLFGWGNKYKPGKSNSPYTWLGGLIQTQRTHKLWDSDMYLGKVAKPAARGDKKLFTDFSGTPNAGKRADQVFKAGEWMALRMYENMNTDLAKSLMNNKGVVGSKVAPMFGNRMVFTHSSRVLAAGADWLELERPLHVDVQMGFKPLLYKSANFKVTGVGIEDLAIEFPWTPYMGHHEEKGFNAIEYEAAVNSWIRRIRITNADAAIKLYSSSFNTVSDIQITQSRPRSGQKWVGRSDGLIADKDGHMGIALHWACFDNLVEKFNITGSMYHELLVAGYSAHNVFSSGFGTDLTLDHHGGVPHNNLWTNIDLGAGYSAMDFSGDPQHFPFAGSNNVFWNVYASRIPVPGRPDSSVQRYQRRAQRIKGVDWVYNRPAYLQGYAQVVVDMPVDTNSRYVKEAGDWFVWYDPNKPVYPTDLYQAQRATQSKRLKLAGGEKIRPSWYPRKPTPA